jgi:hypothetical protein
MFSVDVSELVGARADVRRKEEQLRQVLDALPAAVRAFSWAFLALTGAFVFSVLAERP